MRGLRSIESQKGKLLHFVRKQVARADGSVGKRTIAIVAWSTGHPAGELDAEEEGRKA